MARQGNTTRIGLGYPHQRDRRRALAAMTDGTPCPFDYCGHAGMYRDKARNYDGRVLHYDDYPGRAYGGPQVKRLAHATCNIKAGQVIAARLRQGRPRVRRPRAAAYTRW